MARVRDYFDKRDGGENDAGRDESPPAAKQEGDFAKKQLEMHKFSGSCSKSEHFQTCPEPLVDFLNDTSQEHNYASDSKPEKSEMNNMAESATGAESTLEIPDDSLHSNYEPASAECQNIKTSTSKTEGDILRQEMIYEHINNISSGPVNSVVSCISSESLDSQTSSFTCETVAAPLNHNTYDNQNLEDLGNPVWSFLNQDLTHSGQNTKIREGSLAVATDRGINDKVQENVMKTHESSQECQDVTPQNPPNKQQTSWTDDGTVDQAEKLQDPGEMTPSDRSKCLIKPTSANKQAHPHPGNILHVDIANVLLPKGSFCPQGEAQEDNMTCDLQCQALVETQQKHTQRQDVLASVETSLLPHHLSLSKSERVRDATEQHSQDENKCVGETNTDMEIVKTRTLSTTNAISEEKILETLHDLNPNNYNVAEEASCVSCCEAVEENCSTTHETSLGTYDVEEQSQMMNYSYKDETKQSAAIKVGDVAESTTEVDFIHDDMFVQFREEETLKEELIQSEKIENQEMEGAVSKQEEVKNWEMMVEEEENIAIRYDKEGDDEDKDGQLDDTWIETAFENRNEIKKKDDKLVDELTAAGEKEYTTKDPTYSEDIQSAKNNIAKKDKEEEIVNDTKVEKKEEQEEIKINFTEMQEVSIEKSNVLKVKEEKMEKDQNGKDKVSVERRDQEKPREKKEDWNQEMLAEAGKTAIVDAESEGVTLEGTENEGLCFEESLNVTQNEAEGSLSAPVSSLYNKDKEKRGAGHHTHIPGETHLHKEEGFQSMENITHERSNAENESAAAERCLCISTDEPESDQTSPDSTSAESDSDDEVELYMHCLRAVHSGTEAPDRNKDPGFTARKRPSVSKSQSTPMPPISESLDEEQPLSCIQGNNDDTEKIDTQPTALAGGQEHITGNVSWWKETFSCSKISKTLLYVTLLVVFLVVAYHYDFLACFGLYLISVIWLCCQEETQPVKNNNRLD